jgi:ferredoxin-NADP reductase
MVLRSSESESLLTYTVKFPIASKLKAMADGNYAEINLENNNITINKIYSITSGRSIG